MTDVSWQDINAQGNAPDSHSELPARKPIAWTKPLGYAALFLVLLFSSHSFQFLFADSVADGLSQRPSARENPVYLMMFAIQIGLFGVLCVTHIIRNGIRMPFIIAATYCVLVLASVTWSISPSTSLVPAILFSYLVMAAYTTSTLFTPREVLRFFYYLGVFILVSSYFLLLTGSPEAGQERWGGGWLLDIEFSGVMSSKNFAGIVFASLAILSINAHYFGIHVLVRSAVFCMATLAVLLSNSATAVLIVAILLVPSIILTREIRSWPFFIAILGVVLALAIPALPFISGADFLTVLGRDASFTGRGPIWAIAFDNFYNYPVLGHGYYAFFNTDAYSPVWGMWEQSRYWQADNFHNSSVDIMVSLGLVGVTLMVLTAIASFGIITNTSVSAGVRICLGLLLCVFCIGSMMEFAFFHHNYIATYFLFYVFFSSMWYYGDQQS